jgi:hypothetical protein
MTKTFFSFTGMKRGQIREEVSADYQCHAKVVRKHEKGITATILPEITHVLPRAILTPSQLINAAQREWTSTVPRDETLPPGTFLPESE